MDCDILYDRGYMYLGEFSSMGDVLARYDATEGATAKIGGWMYRFTDGAWITMAEYVGAGAEGCGLVDTARFVGVYTTESELMHHCAHIHIEGAFGIVTESRDWRVLTGDKWVSVGMSQKEREALADWQAKAEAEHSDIRAEINDTETEIIGLLEALSETIRQKEQAIKNAIDDLSDAQSVTQEVINTLSGELEQTAQKVVSNSADISLLGEDVDKQKEIVEHLGEELDETNDRLDEISDSVDALRASEVAGHKLISSVSEKADAIDERVDVLTEKVDTLTEKADTIDGIAEKADTISDKVDNLTERVDAIPTDITSHLAVIPFQGFADEYGDGVDGMYWLGGSFVGQPMAPYKKTDYTITRYRPGGGAVEIVNDSHLYYYGNELYRFGAESGELELLEHITSEDKARWDSAGAGLTQWQIDYLNKQQSAERESKFLVSLNPTPVNGELNGEEQTIRVGYSASFGGLAIVPNVTGTSANLKDIVFGGGGGYVDVQMTLPESSNGKVTETFSARFSHEDEYGEIVKNASASVSRYAPMKFVCGNEATISLFMSSNQKKAWSSVSGDYSVDILPGEYLWICVPAFLTIKSFTSGGFAIPMEPPITTYYNIGPTRVEYRLYRTSGTPKSSPMKITLA